ncbi:uncharacterized protein LOC128867209, partial [Anastrepha ludens]|uniref:uncharacterized protein LOC128867209 n=1 Tax=Anastrepha ludens TaxID=28586 RepID=UPI0023AFC819
LPNISLPYNIAPLPGNNNNNNNNADGQSNNTKMPTGVSAITTTTAIATPSDTSAVLARKSPQPVFPLGVKKHRAPAPPPQAGVAAATVSVIRQSSFLYGSAGVGGASTQQQKAQQW